MTDSIVPYLEKYKLKLSPEFAIDAHYLQKGHWESHLTSYIQYFVRPGAHCVDIGANVGFHTITMADCCGQDGRVYAFEPATCTFPRLVDNINLNPELKPRIVVEKLGVSNRSGNLKLFASGELQGNAYMAEEQNEKYWNSSGPEEFELCIITPLDTYLPPNSKIDFIKIDVEGMELEVLQGASETIKRELPLLVYETLVSCFDEKKIIACERFLQDLGYHFFFLHPSLKKLVPVKAPALAEDTLAIHESQIPKYAEVMYNAAQFALHSSSPLPTAIASLDLTIVGLDKDRFTAEIRPNNTSETIPCMVDYSNGALAIETTINGERGKLTIEAFQEGEEFAQKVSSCTYATSDEKYSLQYELSCGRLLNRTFFNPE